MQENRLKHRLKQDVALNAEGLKVVQALMREKYISFTEALLFSEKVQDDYIYPCSSRDVWHHIYTKRGSRST